MRKDKIENLDHLRVRIAILKLHRAEQEIYLNQTVSKVSRALNSPLSFIKGLISFLGFGGGKKSSDSEESDWVTNLARIALPFILNKTLLSGRGFIFKWIVSFISQNTINAKNFNQGILSNWVDKLVNWVESSSKKRKQQKETDYGIPPDSETSSGRPIH